MQSGTDTVSYNYDLNKNMTSEVINNALTHSVTYNKHNSVKTAENKFGNAVHSSYSYEVLKNGNVSSVSETLAGASRQRAFEYDGIGRLTKETDGTNEISYTYDASGNRLTFDKTALSQRSYGYLPGNISWYSTSNNAFAEYTHDNNGNILSKTGNRVTDYTMTYDGFNRLVSAAVEGGTSASYEYNGDGLRTAKTAKGTRTEFIWDGDRLVCEISGESVTVYKYGNRLFGFEKDGSFSTPKEDRWQNFDAGIAAQTFCLAAYEKGLGSVILGYFDDAEVKKVIPIPEGQQVGAMIPIGFLPEGEIAAPPRKDVDALLTFI